MSYLEQYGTALIDNGYKIVPISPGCKYPKGLRNWEKQNATKQDVTKWLKHKYSNAGVGILTKHTPAIDLDVRDPEVVEKLVQYCEENFGETLQRIGDAPKTLLVYRVNKPFSKVQSKTYVDMFGLQHKVEILGDGQQFVAFAIHPGTKKPYIWTGSDVSNLKHDDLPTLTQFNATQLVEYFESIIPSHWDVLEEGQASTVAASNDDILNNIKPKVDVSKKRLELSLTKISAESYSTWFKVGMALYHQFDGDVEGFEMWDRWSKTSTKYDAKQIDFKWDSFESDLRKEPVTAASILELSKEAKLEVKKPVGFGLVHAREILAKLGPVDWLIKGFIEKDSTGLMFGDPANYKSFISIDMALHVAAGKEWHGFPVKQGPVIYVAGEGHNGFARRLAAWQQLHDDQDINDMPIYFSLQAAGFYDMLSAQAVTEQIDMVVDSEKTQPAMIVIDTLARNFGAGDENSTSDMNTFVSHVDTFLRAKYGCVVMIVHHTGKADKKSARGSSALKGAVDFEYRIERPEDQDELTCLMVNTKMKDAPQPSDLWFSGTEKIVGDFDEDVTSLVFETVSPPSVKSKSEQLKKAQLALFNFTKQQVEMDGYIEREELKKIAVEYGTCRDGKSFNNTLQVLIKKGLLENKDNEISLLDEFV